MSDTDFDVVIAAYLIPDLAQQDFDALVGLVRDKQLTVEGVALVTNDADGTVTINETGDHLGRKGLEIGGGVGLVVGLFAPPLLASVVVGGAAGALVGKFARHRVESGLEEKMGAALPPGSAGIVAIDDRGKADTVDAARYGSRLPTPTAAAPRSSRPSPATDNSRLQQGTGGR